jgi:hypothetical protein
MNMLNFKKIIIASSLLASVAAQASIILPADTLLNNGGFESPDIGNNTWEYYTSTHNTAGVAGWSYDGSGMEIWDSLIGVEAIEGGQHAELNAHGANNQAYSFRQTFDTVIGAEYNYGFAYRARQNTNEEFLAGIVGINATDVFDDHTKSGWSVFSGSFFATDITSTIAFQSNDQIGDTTGNLLDAVYVTKVSEPGTMALLGLGLLGLGFARRKQNQA